MKNPETKWLAKTLMLVSIMLFILVLIGVYLIEPIADAWTWIDPLAPFIVLTGFFIFLVSVTLFTYGIYLLVKRE